jgi:general secretion pathway protein J
MTRNHRNGFTLIEVLVAIAILGVVALLAYRATAAMTDSEARLAQESERWRTLDMLFARLEADMRQAIPRGARNGGRAEPPWVAVSADSAGNSALAFTRAGPEFLNEPGIAGQRIGYRLRDGTIEALYWPQLDNVPTATASAYTLARDIQRFRIYQLGANGGWSQPWPPPGATKTTDALPRAVRIEIGLADGTTIDRIIALK